MIRLALKFKGALNPKEKERAQSSGRHALERKREIEKMTKKSFLEYEQREGLRVFYRVEEEKKTAELLHNKKIALEDKERELSELDAAEERNAFLLFDVDHDDAKRALQAEIDVLKSEIMELTDGAGAEDKGNAEKRSMGGPSADAVKRELEALRADLVEAGDKVEDLKMGTAIAAKEAREKAAKAADFASRAAEEAALAEDEETEAAELSVLLQGAVNDVDEVLDTGHLSVESGSGGRKTMVEALKVKGRNALAACSSAARKCKCLCVSIIFF